MSSTDRKRPGPTRRWFQFSLRTTLVLIAVLGLWLALWTNRARQEKRALAAILESGAHVVYEHDLANAEESYLPDSEWFRAVGAYEPQPPGPAWLRRLLGDEYFVRVVEVEFRGREVTDSRLEGLRPHLESLGGLRGMMLHNTAVTDAGLAQLRELSRLHSLMILNSPVTDVGIEHVSRLSQLQHLDLRGTKVTGDGLAHLREMKNLRQLTVYGLQVDGVSVADFQQALPKCKIVR